MSDDDRASPGGPTEKDLDPPDHELHPMPRFRDRYVPAELLGEGGMGEVMLCRDERLRRHVAVKRLHARRFESGLGRFLREARVQARLDHPAIVPIHDLAEDDTGRPYFTMKRVQGHTLAHIIDGLRSGDEEISRRFSRRRLLEAMDRLCLAMDFAHRHGVCHRDLKPANVMLGEFGEVYVLDWGLAKEIEVPEGPVDEEAESWTSPHEVFGTPGYMAPEQALSAKDVGAAADIFALGAILFELLTLEPLLPADQPPVRMLMSTVNGVDARPSVRAPQRDVPPELEAVCVKATQLGAEDRFASARAMSDALEAYLDGDRDMQLRRSLAAEHSQRARRMLEEPHVDESARRAIMLELGRSLALDPKQRDALQIMMELVERPPTTLPREVTKELEQRERRSLRVGGYAGAAAYACWFVFAPVVLWMGVLDWVAFATMLGCMAGSIGVSLWSAYANPRSARWRFLAVVALSNAGLAATSLMFGPFLVLPAIAAVNAFALILIRAPDPIAPPVAIIAGFAAVALPYTLEAAGLVEPSFRIVDGIIEVLPRMHQFSPVATLSILLGTSLTVVAIPAFVVAQMARALHDAERRLRVRAWHLRQLVPGPE